MRQNVRRPCIASLKFNERDQNRRNWHRQLGAVHTLRPSRSVSGGMIKDLARSPHHVPRSGIESPKSSIVPSLAEVALGGLVRLYSFNNVAVNRIAQIERIKKASGWCS